MLHCEKANLENEVLEWQVLWWRKISENVALREVAIENQKGRGKEQEETNT
ncbi:predicted protein [Sclerotinia sclerotiorum 1980 UF-70]|uniref:Uncharacterized protein n=1 Tax=Sclerotinia sclerotiorum (strain ATCC 18683 / 1980 / Ss-1) TaxID=665079 RepID=A7E3Z9_SCLS1|nr:predicted protein [Sclerotinia sclerotiorum 1980 UF-70]EDN90621.1 predicted protein [Sclerotinia sclerotiorum 1980 UF-70]